MYIDTTFCLNTKNYKKNPNLFLRVLESFSDYDTEPSTLFEVYKKVKSKSHKKRLLNLINKSVITLRYWNISDIVFAENHWNIFSKKSRAHIINKLIECGATEKCDRSRWRRRSYRFGDKLSDFMRDDKTNQSYVLEKSAHIANFNYIDRLVKEKFEGKFNNPVVINILKEHDKFQTCLYLKKDMEDYIKRRKLMRLLADDPTLKRQLRTKVEFTKKDLMSLIPRKRFEFLKNYYGYIYYSYKMKKKSLGTKVTIKLTLDDINQALFSQAIEDNETVSDFINKYKRNFILFATNK